MAMHVDRSPDPARTNVLFILNSLCVGGAEKQAISLINGLDTTRYAVSLLYLKREEALLGQIDPASCSNGIKCLGVKKGVEWRAIRELSEHLRDKRIDVIVCTNMFASLYGWLARRRARQRRKIHLVEVFHTTDVGSFKERLSMTLYRPLMRLTELLIYVCKSQALHWKERGLRSRQEAVIYNGIDSRHFEDVWSPEEKTAFRASHGIESADYVIGLCAVMRPEKAHSDLLAAIAQLRETGVGNVKCLLIGDGPERERIEAQIRGLGLTDSVRITGFMQDVRPAIAACDVMVLASHHVETFSIAALEAMALGKPMVMTRIGGASEQVVDGESGFLYPAGDIGALATSLRTLSNPALRSAKGSKAATRVREAFDLSRMIKNYEVVLSDLVSGRPVRSALGERLDSAA